MNRECSPRLNVFILGLDEFHREQLGRIRDAERYAFQPLLSVHDLFNRPEYCMNDLIDRAVTELDLFPEPVGGVTGYWDFPTTELIPIVAEQFGLHGPSLEAVVRCDHKYLSRIAQQAVVPELVPDFQLVDPFDPDAAETITLPYPYWIKPVRSHSSYLGFRIGNARDLHYALQRIREENIAGNPFGLLMERVELPAEVQEAGGTACIAEQIIGGLQCTVEGYVAGDEVTAYGVIDSIRGPNRTSFERYQYPSRLPQALQRQVIAASEQVVRQLGLNDSAFNVEFFFDRARRQIWLLEINPRISQSHSELFYLVDGAPNSQVSVRLATGDCPDMPHREGPSAVAAKFMVRSYQDGIVRRVPEPEDIAGVEERFPGTRVTVDVTPLMRLSDLPWQDSYSYELAQVYTGARDTQALMNQYDEILKLLDFRVEPVR